MDVLVPSRPSVSPGPGVTPGIGVPRAAAVFIAAAGASLFLAIAATHVFNKDEIEHIHAAWLVSTGLAPYRDFFEHHHPLMWNLYAIVLPWLGQHGWVLLVFRAITFCQVAAIAVLTHRLARATVGDRTAGLSLALLATMSAFGRDGLLIRPDTPQALCVVAAAFVLARSKLRSRDAGVAGTLLGLGFLFSLKALVTIAVIGPLLLAWLFRRRVGVPFLLAMAGACLAPIGLYLVYLIASGSFRDYYLANWLLNVDITAGQRSASLTPGYALWFNFPFWIIGLGGAAWWLFRAGATPAQQVVAVNAIGTIAILVALGRTENRSILVAVPFVSIAAAAAFDAILRWLRLSHWTSACVLVALTVTPVVDLTRWLPRTHRRQLEVVDFVLRETSGGDLVYDGNCSFNLFRRDPDYFWFHPTLGDHTLGKTAAAARIRSALALRMSRTSYDACDLLRTTTPRIVFTVAADPVACGLEPRYERTPYQGMWRRRL